MRPDEIIARATEVFKQNFARFCENNEVDVFDETNTKTLIECLKKSFAQSGTETLKMFYESLDVSVPSVRVDGRRLGRKPSVEKEVLTPFGSLNLKRSVYQAQRGGETYAPLDVKLRIVDEYAVPESLDGILFLTAMLTPEEVRMTLEKNSFYAPSMTAIRNMYGRNGKRMEALRDELLEAVSTQAPPPAGTEVMVASYDATTVPLRSEVSDGGPVERKMAMAGVVSFYGSATLDDKGCLKRDRIGSMALGRMPQDKYPVFKKMFGSLVETSEAGLPVGVTKILLCDAATHIWKHLDEDSRYEGYLKLVDYYHAAEHLKKAVELLFGVDTVVGKKWKEKWTDWLLNHDEGAGKIVRSIDYHQRTRRMGKLRAGMLDTERTYFVRNKSRMRYAEFRRHGLPIGSGPVEAACKTLIKARLCQSGMKWSIDGGQHILTMRSYVKSGQWNNMWSNYMALKDRHVPQYATAA
jgi:hypothetical protein